MFDKFVLKITPSGTLPARNTFSLVINKMF
jgi:hypothetical protein